MVKIAKVGLGESWTGQWHSNNHFVRCQGVCTVSCSCCITSFTGFCRGTMASMYTMRTPTVQEASTSTYHPLPPYPHNTLISMHESKHGGGSTVTHVPQHTATTGQCLQFNHSCCSHVHHYRSPHSHNSHCFVTPTPNFL